MKRKIFALMLILSILLTCTLAVSASDVTAGALFSVEKNAISVFGTAEGPTMVTIIPFEQNITDVSEEKMPAYMGQLDAEGEFSFDIKMLYSIPSGKYTAYVSCANGYAQDSFMYFDADSANTIITEMNKKASLQEYKDAAGKKELGIDETDENYLQNQDRIFEVLYKTKPIDIVAFSKIYNKIYVLSSVEGAEKAEILALLEKYQSVLEIDYKEIIKDDERLSEEIMDEFVKLLSEINYLNEFDDSGEIDFEKLLEDAKALAAVRCAESWTELKQTISVDFGAFFEDMLSYEKYELLSDINKVYQEMFDTDFDSIAEIHEVFQDICDTVYDDENEPILPSRPSSSSSGGASISAPVAKPDTDIKPGESTSTVTGAVFSDLTAKDWCYEAVIALKEKEIINGYEDGSFKPSKSVTRAEFIKMIISGLADKQNDVNTFGDVFEADWYYPYIMKARRLNIAEGNNNMFMPNDNISRQDAALITFRVLKLTGNEPKGFRPFADWEEISDYASEAVLALGCAGFVNGNSENMFLPNGILTRAEAAQMIYNISGLQ